MVCMVSAVKLIPKFVMYVSLVCSTHDLAHFRKKSSLALPESVVNILVKGNTSIQYLPNCFVS